MEFNPSSPVIKLCIQGMGLEGTGDAPGAASLFLQAWNGAASDFERYISAFFVARRQEHVSDRLKWLDTALQCALRADSVAAASAFPELYSSIATCYQALGDTGNATKNFDIADSFRGDPSDTGPFYHGTKADLQVGDLLIPGGNSNYRPDLVMNHIYFTALTNGAGLAAALAKGDGRERVYIVGPTGPFENDPNVTNKKFPGNPTRSYRSHAPLKILGEATDWVRITPEELRAWREKLASGPGKIIN